MQWPNAVFKWCNVVFIALLHWKALWWHVCFRLFIFIGSFVGTCVFRPYAAASVERIHSGSSYVKNFEHPAPSQFLMRHRCARFRFSELGESYIFRERIPEALDRRNNSTFSLLIVRSVSFESLIFFTFYIFSLKNYIYTVSI